MNILPLGKIDLTELNIALRAGATFVYPTETCYGLGCAATNEAAVRKIFQIKNRPETKSLLVIVPDIAMAQKYLDWTPTVAKLAARYWPGPLTIVAPIKEDVLLPAGLVGADKTIALRVTAHPFLAALGRELGEPLVSTSANIGGQDSPYSIAAVVAMFDRSEYQPDIVIDGGVLPTQLPSTLVRVDGEKIIILRQGELKVL